MYNQGLTGKEFDAGDGETAIYVDERRISKGFNNIIRCLPHRAFDHLVYGRKVGGGQGRRDGSGWVGIGQPYPMGDDWLDDVRAYCDFIGLSMEFIGESTHYEGCWRIVFKKSNRVSEAWDIAINSSSWGYPEYDPEWTEAMVRSVCKRMRGSE